jgi:hypothetical protein
LSHVTYIGYEKDKVRREKCGVKVGGVKVGVGGRGGHHKFLGIDIDRVDCQVRNLAADAFNSTLCVCMYVYVCVCVCVCVFLCACLWVYTYVSTDTISESGRAMRLA